VPKRHSGRHINETCRISTWHLTSVHFLSGSRGDRDRPSRHILRRVGSTNVIIALVPLLAPTCVWAKAWFADQAECRVFI
jgi:hypothetical protein